MLLKVELHQPRDYVTSVINQKNVTDGVTLTSIFVILLHQISAAMDRLCQIALNRKLSRKVEKWSKFSSRVKAKSLKM
jgi:hypothetical protein